MSRAFGQGLNINDNKLSATDHVELLGIDVDNKLKYNKHAKTLCSKVTKKISAFSRLTAYISREQALTIYNAVILSNFNYCPLIWLFCNKGEEEHIVVALEQLGEQVGHVIDQI